MNPGKITIPKKVKAGRKPRAPVIAAAPAASSPQDRLKTLLSRPSSFVYTPITSAAPHNPLLPKPHRPGQGAADVVVPVVVAGPVQDDDMVDIDLAALGMSKLSGKSNKAIAAELGISEYRLRRIIAEHGKARPARP